MHFILPLRNIVSKPSAVHRGVAFEERSLKFLQEHLSMSLRRIGGKSDGGIDLQGWWWLPHRVAESESSGERRRLRVLAQCKAEKKKIGPNYVREMEGVLHRYLSFGVAPLMQPAQKKEKEKQQEELGYPVIALLISESRFTQSTLLRAQSSPIPFFLLHLPQASDEGRRREETEIGAAFWNPALASEKGVLGGEMEARWEYSATSVEDVRVGLWWRGCRLKSWVPEQD